MTSLSTLLVVTALLWPASILAASKSTDFRFDVSFASGSGENDKPAVVTDHQRGGSTSRRSLQQGGAGASLAPIYLDGTSDLGFELPPSTGGSQIPCYYGPGYGSYPPPPSSLPDMPPFSPEGLALPPPTLSPSPPAPQGSGPLAFTAILQADYATFVSGKEAAFQSAVQNAVGNAIGVPPSAITVYSVRPGSVVVAFGVDLGNQTTPEKVTQVRSQLTNSPDAVFPDSFRNTYGVSAITVAANDVPPGQASAIAPPPPPPDGGASRPMGITGVTLGAAAGALLLLAIML